VVATGRSDFPNQVNNSLVFPGIFRGALDVRARTISDPMCFAAAAALADAVGGRLDEEHLLPTMEDWEVVPTVAAAVGLEAQAEGLARLSLSRDKLLERAHTLIARSRALTQTMMERGFIPPAPEAPAPEAGTKETPHA
jgi:malate dehydrogenase (oxaloacetate-decarboxylating)